MTRFWGKGLPRGLCPVNSDPLSDLGAQCKQVTVHLIFGHPLGRIQGIREGGRWEGSSLLSSLSFCSDRVVPAADSSGLKHENTQDPKPVFFISSWGRGEGAGAKRAHTAPACMGSITCTLEKAEQQRSFPGSRE